MKNLITSTIALALALSASQGLAQTTPGKVVAGKVPMDTMAMLPFIQDPRMSPDGTKVAVALGAGDSLTYAIIDLSKPGSKPITFARSTTFKDGGDKEIQGWRWVGNDNLVMRLASRENLFGQRVDLGRLVGYSLKTGKLTPIAWDEATGNASTILYADEKSNEILLSRHSSKYGTERYFRPEVVRVNVETGKIVSVIQQPNPIVNSWFADSNGVVRMGFGGNRDNGKEWQLYRSSGKENMKTAETVVDKDFVGAGIEPEIFLDEPDMAIVMSNHEGYKAVYKANLKTRAIVEKIFSVPGRDVDGIIPDADRKKVKGYFFTTDRGNVKWVDSTLIQVQAVLDEQFGKQNAMIESSDRANSKFVVKVADSSQPGGHYVFDTVTGNMALLGWHNPNIKDGRMNPVKAFKYKASDGLEIEAVLTMPRSRASSKKLPIVVLTHGGPYGVRDNADYDDWAQTIAEQGYVVVQPNYRGSGGYGKDFVKSGRKNGFGTRMQDDLNDVVDYLASQGTVDPKRACMMGWSYGGYASARAAQRDPQRWRCTIAGAGVYDLQMMRRYDEDYLGSFGAGYLAKGAEELSVVSPAQNTKTKWSPILVVHGVRDPRVPIEQGRTLVSRLKSSGKVKGVDYDYIEQPRNGHYGRFFTKAERIEWLQGATNWLNRFNPAYVASDADKPPVETAQK